MEVGVIKEERVHERGCVADDRMTSPSEVRVVGLSSEWLHLVYDTQKTRTGSGENTGILRMG